MNNEINIYGAIGSDYTTSMLISSVKKLQADNSELDSLVLNINSPGGDLTQAESMVKYLEGLGLHITTIAQNWVASSATYLFLCGHDRIMEEGAKLMFHYPQLTYNTDLSTENIKILDAEWDSEKKKMIDFYSKRTKLGELEWSSILENDEVINSNDAYIFGITTSDTIIPNFSINKYAVVAHGSATNNNNMSLAEIRKQTLALALQKSKANRTAVKKTLTDERVLDFYRIEEGEEIKVGTEVKWSDGTEVEDGKYTFKSGEEVTIKDSKVTEYKGLEESETEAESEDVEERAEELAIEILEEEKETMADEIAKVIDDAVDEAVELAVTEVQKDIIALRAENEKLTKKLEAVTKPKRKQAKKSASGSQYASTKMGKDIDSLLAGAAKFKNRFKK